MKKEIKEFVDDFNEIFISEITPQLQQNYLRKDLENIYSNVLSFFINSPIVYNKCLKHKINISIICKTIIEEKNNYLKDKELEEKWILPNNENNKLDINMYIYFLLQRITFNYVNEYKILPPWDHERWEISQYIKKILNIKQFNKEDIKKLKEIHQILYPEDNKIDSLITNQKYKEAITLLEKNKTRIKNDFIYYSQLATCYFGIKNYEKAIESCNKSLEIKNDRLNPKLILAKIYELKWEKEKCINIYNECIPLFKRDLEEYGKEENFNKYVTYTDMILFSLELWKTYIKTYNYNEARISLNKFYKNKSERDSKEEKYREIAIKTQIQILILASYILEWDLENFFLKYGNWIKNLISLEWEE